MGNALVSSNAIILRLVSSWMDDFFSCRALRACKTRVVVSCV